MVVVAGVGDGRSTGTGIVRHLNTSNAMNMRNIASDAALSDVIRDYFVQRDLSDSELSELNYDSDESSDSVSAVGVAGVAKETFSPIQFFQNVTFSCY